MAELHVRGFPPELHERLRTRAAAQGRSMSSEAVAILRQALLVGDQPARRQAAIERLAELRARTRLPRKLAPAEDLVREDRLGRAAAAE